MTAPGDLYIGCLGPDGKLAVASSVRDLARRKIEHSMVLRWEAGRFDRPVSTSWTGCELLAPGWDRATFLLVGPRAQLLSLDSKGGHVEIHPKNLVLAPGQIIRGACRHDGGVWLVGSQGTLLRVADDFSVFDHSSKGALSAPNDLPNFECACSDDSGSLYCAGWDGQIWIYANGQWTVESTPANTILTSMCHSGNGRIYAVGQAGTVIRGRKGQWEVLEQAVREDLWSCAWFEETLYASSSRQLLMLEEGELCTVELPDDPATFGRLSVRDKVMLSIGASDLLLLLPDRMLKLT